MSSTREKPVTKSYIVKSDDPKINGAHLLRSSQSHQKKPALPRSTAPICSSGWRPHCCCSRSSSCLRHRPLPFSPCRSRCVSRHAAATRTHLSRASSLLRLSRSETHVCKSCMGQLLARYRRAGTLSTTSRRCRTCPRGMICPNHRPTISRPRHQHLMTLANPFRVYAPLAAAPRS